jgi:hypothetical protein
MTASPSHHGGRQYRLFVLTVIARDDRRRHLTMAAVNTASLF